MEGKIIQAKADAPKCWQIGKSLRPRSLADQAERSFDELIFDF